MWHVWGRRENYTGGLVGKLGGKGTLGNCGRKWEDDVKITLKEIEFVDLKLVNLGQERG
jgi:hypothetical protein